MSHFIASAYKHVQTVPATVWTIAHNTAYSGSAGTPIVDVFVDVNGTLTKIIPAIVEMVDNTTVRLTFSSNHTGTAIVVV